MPPATHPPGLSQYRIPIWAGVPDGKPMRYFVALTEALVPPAPVTRPGDMCFVRGSGITYWSRGPALGWVKADGTARTA